MQTKGSIDGSWVSCLTGHGSQNVTHCHLCIIAKNETPLNQMAESVDDEQ